MIAPKAGALLVVILVLPAVLLVSAVRTLRELDEQRIVYLRSLAANFAGRLENIPAGRSTPEEIDSLLAQEPQVAAVRVISPNEASGAALEALWSGRELYRTEFIEAAGERLFRAYVPFHSQSGLRIARIDVPSGAADFLMVHAQHNVILAGASAVVLLLLAGYALWSARRAAELQQSRLALEHLAHIGEMAAVLAHEIRNPLATIKGYAQLLGEHADARAAQLVTPILSETRRLEHLVNDLLAYGRPPQPRPRLVQWSEILGSLASEAESNASPENERRAFRTDPDILQQILLNLVRNAREATAKETGAEVQVRLRERQPAGIEIEVIDNGPGIPQNVRQRLFQPFFTTKAFGTGLGLAISRKLARSLGGEVELQPLVPRGTRAVLTFPAIELTDK